MKLPVGNCTIRFKSGFPKTCILLDSLLNNCEVNSWHVCLSNPLPPEPLGSSDADLTWGRTNRHERDVTQVCWPANGMETEGKMSQVQPKHTHTHTPACNSSHSFPDNLSSNTAEVTWISYNEIREVKNKTKKRKEERQKKKGNSSLHITMLWSDCSWSFKCDLCCKFKKASSGFRGIPYYWLI